MSRGEREVMYSIKYAANPIGIYAQWMFSIGFVCLELLFMPQNSWIAKKPALKKQQ